MWLQDEVAGRKSHLTSRERRRRRAQEEEEGEEERGEERERERDITMQSAPSAQRLRCGLAPSSQSQPDPHIALIYLERGEWWCWGCEGE